MTTLEALQEQLETTQLEANLLRQTGDRLNAAKSQNDLLAVLANPGLDNQVSWAALYATDQPDSATWGEVVTVWAGSGQAPLPAGMRFHTPQFPFTTAWSRQPTEALFIADIATDNRLDPNSRNTLANTRSRALAVVPLIHAGNWVGFVSLSWDQPHPFSPLETSIYQSYTSLASAMVLNQRLQNKQSGAMSHTLFDISAMLSKAEDEEELLRILTQPSLKAGVSVSMLAYVDLDQSGQPAWAEIVSTWQQEGARVTSDLVAAIWSQIITASQPAGQPPQSSGSRYYIPEFPFTPLWFADQREPQLIANVATDFRVNQIVKNILSQVRVQAVAAIPLAVKDRWLGAVCMFWNSPHPFTEEEISLYRAFTTLVSPAIANRRHEKIFIDRADQQAYQAHRYKTLLESVSQPIALCDPHGNHLFANPAYQQLVGYPSLTNTSLSLLLPADQPGLLKELLTGWQGETTIKRQDDSSFDAFISTAVLPDDNDASGNVAILIQDITSQKRALAWTTQQRNLTTALPTADEPRALAMCLETVANAAGFEQARLYLLDDQSGSLTLAAHHGLSDDDLPPLSQFEPDSPIANLLKTATPIYAGAAQLNDQPDLAAGLGGVQAAAIAPVMDQGTWLGALHLSSPTAQQIPDHAPVPLESTALLVAGLITQNRTKQALANTNTRTQSALQAALFESHTKLQESHTQNDAALQRAHAALGLELRELQTRLETELEETRVQSAATLAALQQTNTQLNVELAQTRAQAQAELQAARHHAEETLQQTQTQAAGQLQTVQAQNNAKLQEIEIQNNTALENAQTNLGHNLSQLQATLQTQLEDTQTQAATALTALQQVNTQLDAELAQSRTQAQAELQATRRHADESLQQAKTHAETSLQKSQAALGLELRDLQTRLEIDLEDTRLQATAALAALQQTNAQAQTDIAALQQANSQLDAELAQTRAQAQAALEAAQHQAEAALAVAAAELAETRANAQANQDHLHTDKDMLLTAVSDWVWTTDPAGKLSGSNAAGPRFLGYTASQLGGMSLFSLIHADDRERVRALFEQTPAKLQSGLTIRWLHRDGSVRFCQSSIQTLFDRHGQHVGFRGVEHDITQQQQVEAERAALVSQYRTAADFSDHLNAIHTSQELVQAAVDMLLERFNLYHAQIYIQDESTKTMTMQVCAGPAAQEIQAQGHTIPLNNRRSLVTRCARGWEIAVSNDVSRDPYFSPNSLLPNTRAEVALPLTADQQLFGVLDLHADQPDRFSQTDVDLLNILAGIVAANLANIRLHQIQAETLKEQETLKQQYAQENLALKEKLTQENLTLKEKLTQENRTLKSQFAQEKQALKDTLTREQQAHKDQLTQKQSEFERRLVEVKEQTVRAIPIPVIPVMNQMVVAPVVGEIDAARAQNVSRTVINGAKQHKAAVVFLDVSGVPNLAEPVTGLLSQAIKEIKAQGTQVIVTGLPDSVSLEV